MYELRLTKISFEIYINLKNIHTALKIGVIPSLSAVSSPAPFSMRIRANSRCPLATARASGVDPSISQDSMAR